MVDKQTIGSLCKGQAEAEQNDPGYFECRIYRILLVKL